MSWSELERLVSEAEEPPPLRRSLKGCRSTPELILAARRLGYRITHIDLQRAWEEERQEYEVNWFYLTGPIVNLEAGNPPQARASP